MALVTVSATRLTSTAWRVSWADTVDTYWVYLGGKLLSTQPDASIDIETTDGAVPQVEVATDIDDVPNQILYPWRANLAWYTGDTLPANYHTIELNGTTIDVLVNATKAYTRWQSDILDDQTSYAYTVDPIGASAISGTSQDFTVTIARNPDDPNVTYAYDSGSGEVTISGS